MNRALSSDQEQLVQAITEQVLAMLQGGDGGGDRSNGAGSGAAGAGGAAATGEQGNTATRPGGGGNGAQPHAAIRPPIGVCTGDYSQFPELRGRAGAAPMQRNAGASAGGGQTAGQRTPGDDQNGGSNGNGETLTGIVTASRLEEVAGRGHASVVRLAPEAQLSPLAADLVRDRGLHIERAGGSHTAQATASAASSQGGWLWWIDGQCPAVQQITESMSSSLRPLPRRRESTALAETVGELAGRVQRGEAEGGVLFVPSAAKAGCFANRCESLRAVVASCEQAVIEGVEQLGANVLIVEYLHHGREAMRRMVERFVCTPRASTAAVDRELRELKRCG